MTNRDLVPINKEQINYWNLQYVGTLYMGSERQELNFVFDTGSTQLWVPLSGCQGWPTGSTSYVPSDEFESTGITDYISYAIGYVEGEIITDIVRFTSSGFPCRLKILGVTYGYDNAGMAADGIVGLSPRERDNDELLVTKLYNTKTIEINAFGVSYLNEGEDSKIIFGGYDKSIVPSLHNFTWFNLVNTNYWSINITGVFYNGVNLNAVEKIGILDTGTSLVYFNNVTFHKMFNDMKTKHERWNITNSEWYYCAWDGYDGFEDITLQINGVNLVFPAKSYVEYYPEDDQYEGTWFLHIHSSNFGFLNEEILLGDAFLRNYYIYHDVGNAKVGFFSKDLSIDDTRPSRRNLELEKQHAYFEDQESKGNNIFTQIVLTVAFLLILVFE